MLSRILMIESKISKVSVKEKKRKKAFENQEKTKENNDRRLNLKMMEVYERRQIFNK